MFRSHGSTTFIYIKQAKRKKRPIISIHQSLMGIQQTVVSMLFSLSGPVRKHWGKKAVSSAVTDPEMRHSVDLHCLLNQ